MRTMDMHVPTSGADMDLLASSVSQMTSGVEADSLGPAIVDAMQNLLCRDQDARTKATLDHLIQYLIRLRASYDASHAPHAQEALAAPESHNALSRQNSNEEPSCSSAQARVRRIRDGPVESQPMSQDQLHASTRHFRRRCQYPSTNMSGDETPDAPPQIPPVYQEYYGDIDAYDTYHYPIFALDEVSPDDHATLLGFVGDDREHLLKKSCYCRVCFENDICTTFTRADEGYRHVRETHVDMKIIEKHGGYIKCPYCTKEFSVDRLDTMRPHLVTAHGFHPDPPAGRGKQKKPELEDIEDKNSAAYKVVQVRNAREARFGDFNSYKATINSYWRNHGDLLRADVKTERAEHNSIRYNAIKRPAQFQRHLGGAAPSRERRGRRGPNRAPTAASKDLKPRSGVMKRHSPRQAKQAVHRRNEFSTPNYSGVSTGGEQSPMVLTPDSPSPEAEDLPYGHACAQQVLLGVRDLCLSGSEAQQSALELAPLVNRCVEPQVVAQDRAGGSSYRHDSDGDDTAMARQHGGDVAADWPNLFAGNATSNSTHTTLGFLDTFPADDPYNTLGSDPMEECDWDCLLDCEDTSPEVPAVIEQAAKQPDSAQQIDLALENQAGGCKASS